MPLPVTVPIEALVTPSPLPTFIRIGIGIIAEAAFLSYIVYFGRRAAKAEIMWIAAFPFVLACERRTVFPSIAIAVTMLSFTFFGDGVRDALDPKLK